MTQVLDSLPNHYTDCIFCYYVNFTRRMQIIRIVNISGWYFERVVFPMERILFEALPEAQLEVHTTRLTQPILLECIACNRLRIREDFNNYVIPLKLESQTRNISETAVLNKI